MSAKLEKPPQLKYTKLHEPDIELALQHDALRYVHDTFAGGLPVRPLVRSIMEQAPSVKDTINAKLFANIAIKKPPVLLNILDDSRAASKNIITKRPVTCRLSSISRPWRRNIL